MFRTRLCGGAGFVRQHCWVVDFHLINTIRLNFLYQSGRSSQRANRRGLKYFYMIHRNGLRVLTDLEWFFRHFSSVDKGGAWRSVLQCVAVCCSVLQCGAVWCSVVQCGAVWCSVVQCVAVLEWFFRHFSSMDKSSVSLLRQSDSMEWCSVLQCVTEEVKPSSQWIRARLFYKWNRALVPFSCLQKPISSRALFHCFSSLILWSGAVCCSVLQWSVLQYSAVCCSAWKSLQVAALCSTTSALWFYRVVQCVAVCGSVL